MNSIKLEPQENSRMAICGKCIENERAGALSLVALGIILLAGSAIATWQLYATCGNLAFTGLLLAVPALGVFTAAICLLKERSQPKKEEPVEEPKSEFISKPRVEPPKEVVPSFGKQLLYGDQYTKSLYMLENYQCFERSYAIVLDELKELKFSAENPPIVYFRRHEYFNYGSREHRSGLPDDRVPTKIMGQAGQYLLLFYEGLSSPEVYILGSKQEDGPKGQKLVLASKI